MIRAIESRDLIMDQFPESFFDSNKILKTDRLRECAVYKPVQFPERPSYNTLSYQRKEAIGQANMEASLLEYLHRAEHEDEYESTAIIGRTTSRLGCPEILHIFVSWEVTYSKILSSMSTKC